MDRVNLMLGKVAGTRRGYFESVDEKSSVKITRVEGDHPVVDLLLGALRLVTWGQESASRFRCPAGLKSGSLGVVVLKKNSSACSFDTMKSLKIGESLTCPYPYSLGMCWRMILQKPSTFTALLILA